MARLIGFISVFWLIRNNYDLSNYQNFLISISFSLLPVYTSYGITVLGLPLLCNSFIILAKSKNATAGYLGILFYSSYSLIQYSLPFNTLLVLACLIYFKNNVIVSKVLYGLIFYILITLLLNYSLIETALSLNYQDLTHRVLRNQRSIELPSIPGIMFDIFKQLIFGSGKTNSLMISLPIILGSFFRINKRIFIIYIFIILNILLSAFYQHILYHLSEKYSILASFDFSRIVQLNPFLFYLILIESINKLTNKNFLIGVLLLSQFFLNYTRNSEFIFNKFGGVSYRENYFFEEDNYFKKLLIEKKEIPFWNYKDSYNGYYSKELFKTIEKFIGLNKDSYKIISFGLNPSVTIFKWVSYS